MVFTVRLLQCNKSVLYGAYTVSKLLSCNNDRLRDTRGVTSQSVKGANTNRTQTNPHKTQPQAVALVTAVT